MANTIIAFHNAKCILLWRIENCHFFLLSNKKELILHHRNATKPTCSTLELWAATWCILQTPAKQLNLNMMKSFDRRWASTSQIVINNRMTFSGKFVNFKRKSWHHFFKAGAVAIAQLLMRWALIALNVSHFREMLLLESSSEKLNTLTLQAENDVHRWHPPCGWLMHAQVSCSSTSCTLHFALFSLHSQGL